MAKKAKAGEPEVNPIDGTLDPTPSDKVVIDKEKPIVKSAIKLIDNYFDEKDKQDKKNEKSIKAAEECMNVDDPESPRLTHTMKFMQAFWKTKSRMKPLDYTVHGVGATREMETLVFHGVETVLQQGGFYKALMAKSGAMNNAAAIGDGYILFSTKDKGFPFKFTPIPNDMVFVNSNATGMRTGSKYVRKMAIIIQRQLSEFNELWPEFKDKVGVGSIPRKENILEGIDQTSIQKMQDEKVKIVEEMHWFDLDAKAYGVIAGSGCTVVKEKYGKDYPFTFRNPETQEEEAFIPVLHFMGIPSFKGFYNHGIFHWIYQWAIFARQLFNKIANSANDNADPFQLLSVPMGQGAEVINRLKKARLARAQGRPPVVMVEYDENSPGSKKIGLEAMTANADVSLIQFIDNYIDREIKRMGIHLDESEAAPQQTATKVLSEEENATMFVKQMLEDNAPEIIFLLNMVIDQIPRTVKADKTIPVLDENGKPIVDENGKPKVKIKEGNKTPIFLTVNLETSEGKTVEGFRQMTLGALAEEMKKRIYFPKVNSRSGAITPKLRLEQIARGASIAQAGSRAQLKLYREFADLNDLDLNGEDFLTQQQAGAEMMKTPATDEFKPVISETERQTINPRLREQGPVL